MNPNEFKAWFDGFTEAFDGRIPTKAQWGRIKDRVAEIDGKPVTERVDVDRYWPTYQRYATLTIPNQPMWTTYCGSSSGVSTTTGSLGSAATSNAVSYNAFNSSQAMADLGRAEAASLS